MIEDSIVKNHVNYIRITNYEKQKKCDLYHKGFFILFDVTLLQNLEKNIFNIR